MTTQSGAPGPGANDAPKPKRYFVIDGRKMDDPDPGMTVDEVRQHFADFFPELNNAETSERKEGVDTFVTFAKRVGTKGASRNV